MVISLVMVSYPRVFTSTKMRRKNKHMLSFQDKCDILDLVKAGASKEIILQKYNICDRTYKRVIANEFDLRNKVKLYEYQNKKTARTSSNTVLDAAMIEWFKQTRDRGDPISGPIMKEKAKLLNEKVNGPQTFKASDGWLNRFKKRYGIRMKGETLSNDTSGIAEFSQILKAKIESENLNLDNIYNADESGILWRLLMACSLELYLEEEEASIKKECKDRVTALFCANATGSNRIPLLIIGRSKTPRCLSSLITETSKELRLKNVKSLGVTYAYQYSAWMDRSIFMLWYKDEFIPRVLEHQRTSGITGKVILLLDNATSHPSLDELNAINENFEVVYLPPNVSALIQPMNQRVIETTKKLCKISLLRLLSEDEEGAVKFLKELNLRDCIEMISLAWDSVKLSVLQKAWRPFFGDSFVFNDVAAPASKMDHLSDVGADVNELESPTDLPSFPYEICDQVSELLSGPDYSVEKSKDFLLKWFENNHKDFDCGWEPLSDSDFVNLVTNGKYEPEFGNMKIEKSETSFGNPERMEVTSSEPSTVTVKIEKSESIFENPEPMEITRSEAFDCLMKFKHWLNSSAQCLPKHLCYVKELEDVITENTVPKILGNEA